MKSKSPGADVSIHVTNSTGREAEARGKRREKRKTPKDRAGKRKRESSAEPALHRAPPQAVAEAREASDRPASFRHLFSFAEQGGSAPREEGAPFSLLDATATDAAALVDEAGGEGVDGVPAGSADADVEDGFREGNGRWAEEEDFRAAATANHANAANVASGGALREERAFQPWGREQSAAARGHPSVTRSVRAPATAAVREIDTSAHGVMAMARKYCRQHTIEELEAEWNYEGGIRDQMRKDFKLKRRHILRDRKLGGPQHKR